MSSALKDRNPNEAKVHLRNVKAKMRRILLQISSRQRLITDPPRNAPLFEIAGSPDSFDELKDQFDRLFDEAREQDRILNPHPITLLPVEILHEIFEWAGGADPDASLMLVETCSAWAAIVLDTPAMWCNINIDTDADDEIIESLRLYLHCSKTLPLHITMRGRGALDGVTNELLPHTGRIRTLELRLSRKAKAAINILKGPEGGLASLSTLALEKFPGEVFLEYSTDEAVDPFTRARWRRSALDNLDLRVIAALPSLVHLRALVLHGVYHTVLAPLELPKLETLHLLLEWSPSLLQNFQCQALQSLHVTLEETNREGWWDLLLAALKFKKLDSLLLDVTLDRSKNDWHRPWDMLAYTRLPNHERISKLVVTLMFTDFQYLFDGMKSEYLCGALLEQLVEGLPFLRELHLMHVPFLHAAWIWPSPETLYNLRRLEMNVPAIVCEDVGTVIELPHLEELLYYGLVDPQSCRLRDIRTPKPRYLELMHDIKNEHAFGKTGREWNGIGRKLVADSEYGKRFGNSARDFPAFIDEPLTLVHIPVLHESFRLVELRSAFRPSALRAPWATWSPIYAPDLKALHTQSWVLSIICSPNLEELYLYHCEEDEEKDFADIPLITGQNNDDPTRPGLRLWRLKFLVLYPHVVTNLPLYEFPVESWFPHLESVETLGLPNTETSGFSINNFPRTLCGNPRLLPNLTKIRSPRYPPSWLGLRDAIEVRSHLAMGDGNISALKTIEFPCQVHDYIAEPLQAVLSGRFGVPFRPIPDQPFAISELIPERSEPQYRIDRCDHCIRSGDIFSCLWSGDPSGHERRVCQRHLQDTWVAITGATSELSGYLQ